MVKFIFAFVGAAAANSCSSAEQAAAQKMSVSDFRDAKVKCGHPALRLHSPTHLVHDKFNSCLTVAVGIGSAPLSAKQSLLITASRIAKNAYIEPHLEPVSHVLEIYVEMYLTQQTRD